MEPDELNDMEIAIMRALRSNDASGNGQGLNASMVAGCSKTLGRPIDAPLGDIGRAITGLVRRGLVRRFRPMTGSQKQQKQHRLTAAGFARLKEMADAG